MPPLLGFSNNKFQTRADLLTAATSLLRPLIPYKSACGARIKLSTATGTGFDEVAAQLEGFARPLWVVADLLSLKSKASSFWSIVCDRNVVLNHYDEANLESWIRGLNAGVDPQSQTFWGYLSDYDQRMVEMEPIAYALLAAPSAFLNTGNNGEDEESKEDKTKNLKTWLNSINGISIPPSNWRWFRVLVNLALVKSLGTSYEAAKNFMRSDLELLDSFYLGGGWSSDGKWTEDKKQCDYYSGSFAIQFSQLLYIRFAEDIDPERVERYRSQARQFATSFWRYFDVDGAAIPFGRSLSYRFAFVAFFAAAVAAGVDLPAPLNDLGVVKGLILRHFRWWAEKTDYFNADGTMSIGYTYPNMFLSEDYNSPQSVYWCLKAFTLLGLPEDHQFWTCEELPHPLSKQQPAGLKIDAGNHAETARSSSQPTYVGAIGPALHIICGFPEHHYLLSAGQFTKKDHRAREAKYGKFAYSSAFAFSVPTGNLLEQLAPDSTLCISNDDGENWKIRWNPIDAHLSNMKIPAKISPKTAAPNTMETVPVLVSKWRPWKTSSLEIETVLIPGSIRWPGWHVRIHKMNWEAHEALKLDCVDGGFAISSQSSTGGILPKLVVEPKEAANDPEGVVEDERGCLVLSDAGASGTFSFNTRFDSSTESVTKGYALKPDANTNLIAQRSLIPTIRHKITRPNRPASMTGSGNATRAEAWIATGVFAVARSARLDWATVRSMWNTKPVFA